jgi:hypothetical protein
MHFTGREFRLEFSGSCSFMQRMLLDIVFATLFAHTAEQQYPPELLSSLERKLQL